MYKGIFIDALGGVFVREMKGNWMDSPKRITFSLPSLPTNIADHTIAALEIDTELYKSREFKVANVYSSSYGHYNYVVYEEV